MKLTKTQLKKLIKEELEATNENSRLEQNVVHILYKAAIGGGRHIVGVFSSPEKYEKWFTNERRLNPDFNRDDYDLVGHRLDPL
jgi:hypothetical protein